MKIDMDQPLMSCPMVKGGELPVLLGLRARDSQRSNAWFLGWNRE